MNLKNILKFTIPALIIGLLGWGIVVASPCFVNSGCTGLNNIPNHYLLAGSSTNQSLNIIAPGSDGLFLRASSTAPDGFDFATASTSGGTGLSNLNGLVASTQTFATGTATGIGLNIVSSGSTHTFTPTVTSGFTIPLSASTTQWSGLFNNVLSVLNVSTSSATSFYISTSTNSVVINFPNNLLTTTTAASLYQLQGNYITALTGDGTASGPGSAAFTLATVNSNVGTFGSTSQIPNFTVNGKGLITAAGNNTPSLPASDITSGQLAVTQGGTGVANLGNLTLTSSNLSFGNGDGKLILIGTSTNITLTSNPTFTNLTSTNSSTTNATVSGVLYLTGLSNGCTQIAGGILTSTGVNCGSGSGGSISTSTNAIVGHEANWTSPSTLGNGVILDNGTVAGVNGTSSNFSFDIVGTLNVTASSTLATTTLTQLIIPNLANGCASITGGIIGSTSCGGGGSGGGFATSSPYNITNTFGTQVGINSSTPFANLVVQGINGSTTPEFIVASSSGNTNLTVLANGNVGVNIANPLGQFEVGRSLTGAVSNPIISYNSGTAATGTGSGIAFDINSVGFSDIIGGSIAAITTNPQIATFSSDLIFTNDYLGNTNERMRLTSSGNLGINTTTPTANLMVVGNSASSTENLLNIASTSLISYLTVAANGSTTLSSLGTGCVNASSGSLYTAACSGGISGGTNGQLPFWTSSSALSSSATFLYNGTVFGMNATSSIIGFNIQGTAGTNTIFNVASSSGVSILTVSPLSYVGIGSSSPTTNLVVQGIANQTNNIFTVSSSSGASLVIIGVQGTNGQQLSVNSSTTVNSVVFIGGSTNNPTFPLFTVASTTGVSYLQIDQYGHKLTGGSSPTCGTGCSSVTGDDQTMRVITGSGVTAVTVNFAHAYGETPVCVAADESGGTTVSDASSSPASVTINLSASLTTKSIALICQQSINFTN